VDFLNSTIILGKSEIAFQVQHRKEYYV